MTRTLDVAGNTFNNALNLGTFKNKTRSITDTVGKSDSNDYFRLKLRSTSVSVISLTRLSADVDLEIYYEDRNNPASFSNSGTKSEVAFDDNAPAGTYYIRVLPASSREAEYTLTVHAIALPRSNRTSQQSRTAGRNQFKAMRNSSRQESKRSSLWT